MKPHSTSADDEIPLEKYFPDVPRGTLDSIKKFSELVWEWNHHINLTGAKAHSEFIEQQIFDCLASRGVLSLASHWIDVGSGAGLPGMVWSLVEREKYFLLVESQNKKASVLRRALSLNPNSHVAVETRRFEELTLNDLPWQAESWGIVSRGTAAPPNLLSLATGSVLPWKQWVVFSTKKTHGEFLTHAEKFGMKAEEIDYRIPSLLGPGKEGILTILSRQIREAN